MHIATYKHKINEHGYIIHIATYVPACIYKIMYRSST